MRQSKRDRLRAEVAARHPQVRNTLLPELYEHRSQLVDLETRIVILERSRLTSRCGRTVRTAGRLFLIWGEQNAAGMGYLREDEVEHLSDFG
jgi:hypothetical protein